ncbi:hypothetical protein AV654_19620 [Paenibacillus elgii]|uniref:UmuC domain-containing protein n=1 Tax=Paenibacillus elgii TaxID=189691 RepID=A0A163XNM6_9BACL|nr:hypothetical protein AV654_19620 [Paenibacillus elgii]
MIDYSKLPDFQFICLDFKSYYSSVECVYRGLDPLQAYLAVVDNLNRPGSVVLTASPLLKKEYGIKTGSRLYEIPADPRIIVVPARRERYLKISVAVTKLLNRFVPIEAIHTYSIDEAHICALGTSALYGSPRQLAELIRQTIHHEFSLPTAAGVGPNKLLSKLILDVQGKKIGVAECTYQDIPAKLWPVKIEEIWGIGQKLKQRLNRLGIFILKDLAHFSLPVLRKRFGKIIGDQLYMHSWGVDGSSPFIDPLSIPKAKGYSAGITLLRDFEPSEVSVPIYELADEVTQRMRKGGMVARTISLGIGYSRTEGQGGFSKSITLSEATNISKTIHDACMQLFWSVPQGPAIRNVHVSASNLIPEDQIQLVLGEDPREAEKQQQLGRVMDFCREKYGAAGLFRASSLTSRGNAVDRQLKIGGNYQ